MEELLQLAAYVGGLVVILWGAKFAGEPAMAVAR